MGATEDFAIRAIAAYIEANPDAPDVVAFVTAMDDLARAVTPPPPDPLPLIWLL